MQHSMPTMQELVNYQLDEPSLSDKISNIKLAADMEETDRQIEAANALEEKLEKIDTLVRRYATWDQIYMDVLTDSGQPNKNGITMLDCFDMKSDIMDKIKRLVTS